MADYISHCVTFLVRMGEVGLFLGLPLFLGEKIFLKIVDNDRSKE